MNRLTHLVPLLSLMAISPVAAAPADAARIQKSYQTAVDQWTANIRAATTQDERAKLWAARPTPNTAAREMWSAIGGSLDQEWTLEPMAWFLRTTASLVAPDGAGMPQSVFGKQIDAIRKAIETYHLKSPKLGPVCSALASTSDPRALPLLEKIQASHPDKKVQGIAALGAAIQLKTLGDSADIMTKRLNYLRKAIIQSSDVEMNGTTIAKIAEDELYIIRFLTKGRVAPDLNGVDSGNRPMSLSANQGKVIVLTFWNSDVEDAQRVVDVTTSLQEKFKGRPLVVLGVNNDTVAKLRTLEGDGTVPWKSFSDPDNKLAAEYRVGVRPLVFVLDGERKIRYTGAPGSFVEITAEALLAEPKPAAATPGVQSTPPVRPER